MQSVQPLVDLGAVAPMPVSAAYRYQLIAFLRHIGCPFSEQVVKALRDWALHHANVEVSVVFHGDRAIAERWFEQIGGCGVLNMVHDPDREAYGLWGLGFCRARHFMGLSSLSGVVRLWRQGIRNRIATGTRWQQSGIFLINDGIVSWRHIPKTADEFLLPPNELFQNDGRLSLDNVNNS